MMLRASILRPTCVPRRLPTRFATSHRRSSNQRACFSVQASSDESYSLAPVVPQTPYGEMMAYYLQMEPTLFEEALDGQFVRLKKEREAEESEASDNEAESVALSSLDARIREVKVSERATTVEDLMYMSIIAEFVKLGVGMLPRLDDYSAIEGVNLNPLLEGIHSRDAIDLVKDHMMTLLGQVSSAPATMIVKMAKIQMVQIYAASVMFGYFLRKADNRFQLARNLGVLPESPDDAVSRLEKLFSLASEGSDDLDSASPLSDDDVSAVQSESSGEAPGSEKKSPLREYINSFDRDTMLQTAAIMSIEGANLLDRQSKALWGDAVKLQNEMQEALGMDANSIEELMKRAEAAVTEDKVETVKMSVSTQRRAVLEAVAFGTFLRDSETRVDLDYGLVTRRTLPESGPDMGMLPGV